MTHQDRPDRRGKHSTEQQNGSAMKKLGLRGLVLFHTIALRLGDSLQLSGADTGLAGGSRRRDHPERGDVPGWVMITLMSAVLVAALLALAGPALEGLFNQAMDKVGN